MKTISIAFYHLLSNLRDRKETMVQICSPIILIFILGSALGGGDSDGSFEMTLGLIYDTPTEVSVGLENYLKEVGKESDIDIQKVESIEELESLITNNDIDSGVVVNNHNEIEVLSAPNKMISSNITLQIVESFNHFMTTEAIKSERNLKSLESMNLGVKEHAIEFDGRSPSPIDYYAITMLAMFMMYGAGYGTYAIRRDYFEVRGERIQSTTIKFWEHFSGLALGTIGTIAVQGTVVVLFSKYAFGVNFGENLLFVLFIVLTFAILATGMGMFMSIISKDKNKGANMVSALIPIFTLISGGFMKISSEGTIGIIQKFIPNYHFHEVLMNYAFKTSDKIVTTSLLTLWGMIVICYGGTLILRRRTV